MICYMDSINFQTNISTTCRKSSTDLITVLKYSNCTDAWHQACRWVNGEMNECYIRTLLQYLLLLLDLLHFSQTLFFLCLRNFLKSIFHIFWNKVFLVWFILALNWSPDWQILAAIALTVDFWSTRICCSPIGPLRKT